jgi:hypothetical protein
MGLIPAMSIALTLLSGIILLTVWRGPLTTAKVGPRWPATLFAQGPFQRDTPQPRAGSGSGFFNTMFSVFSSRAYAIGGAVLVQAGQGVIRARSRSRRVRRREGFDVTVVPSAQYLLVVLIASPRL